MKRNPVLQESVSHFFTHRDVRRWYLFYLGTIVVLFLLFWPDRDYFYFFKYATPPAIYSIVLFATLFLGGFLTTRFAVDGPGEESLLPLWEWIESTSVPPKMILWGQIITAFVQSAGLVIVILPLLLPAMVLSGDTMVSLLLSGLLIPLVFLFIRTAGRILLTFREGKRIVINAVIYLFVAWLFIVTFSTNPAINPVVLLVSPLQPDLLTRLGMSENPAGTAFLLQGIFRYAALNVLAGTLLLSRIYFMRNSSYRNNRYE